MPSSKSSKKEPNARFRSATEFPKTVESLDLSDANTLYMEMRECLVYTNRSQAQLRRWNNQHKKDKLQLKETTVRLQSMIQKLTAEKQQLTAEHQELVSNLEVEITTMGTYLDRLSEAFEPFSDIDTPEQTKWHFVSLPGRFFQFLRAVRSIVMWWRDENELPAAKEKEEAAQLPLSQTDVDNDMRDRPQMYSDPASVNRSLLDR
ncbi:MAG: hypothetical protein F6K36_30580 [Symploca sp. SIO3C6]|nr:hypothetical protein [Symploca sp. SIO3C6]